MILISVSSIDSILASFIASRTSLGIRPDPTEGHGGETGSTAASPKGARRQIQLNTSVNPLAGGLDAETVAEDEISPA